MIELTGAQTLSAEEMGGKAFHLNRLISMGVRVPPTVVFPAVADAFDVGPLKEWLVANCESSSPNSWAVAVRSSSALEDGVRESKAGHYLSLLGTFNGGELLAAIQKVRQSGPAMSVIVQPLLTPTLSGVAFSCDPLTYDRTEITIAWTRGLADSLVSGLETGNRVSVSRDGIVHQGTWPAPTAILSELGSLLENLELGNKGPVDVEWLIDKNEQLWLVQARPVVLPEFMRIPLGDAKTFDTLPTLVREHPKIRLRRHAFERGIVMAPAVVECWCNSEPTTDETANDDLGRPAGVSVVLLHPERIQDQIVREFASVRGCDVDFFTRGCRRYSVRRYPKNVGVTAAKRSVLNAGLATSWLSVAIVQAIWDAHATGIIRRSDDGYLIEVAQGHFVPKGVVPTSTVILNHNRAQLAATWRDQPTAYHFVDGHVVTETPPEKQLKLKGSTLQAIASTFDPLFELYKDAALEFGLLERSGDYLPYLIDVAEGDTGGISLDADLIRSGVLSIGKCRGRVHRVLLSAIGELDKHLHDRPAEASVSGENIIVVAERASVELLPFVGAPGIVGFVFERGSILAHLAVVLREKGIPAVTLENSEKFRSLDEDLIIGLNATARLSSADLRVEIIGEAHVCGDRPIR